MLGLLFPPSTLVAGVSSFVLVYAAFKGRSEARGTTLQYSKLMNSTDKHALVPTRPAMVFCYVPSFMACLASFALMANDAGPRLLVLRIALTIHFFKRCFEVLFIHRFSGNMHRAAAIEISLGHLVNGMLMVYAQYVARDAAEPRIDLRYPGAVLFAIGIAGNFYHHYLLSKLRGKNEKEYKIPKGGLFELVICPHYLFEVIAWVGVALLSQNVYVLSFSLGSGFYLMGRSYATRKWYINKFDNFPPQVKAFLPYIF